MSSLWTPGGEHQVDREGAAGGGGAADPAPAPPSRGEEVEGALTPEQQAELEAEVAAMQDQLAATPAAVVVANHAVGLFQLAALHLNRQPPNLEEGRLAIDAMAALVEGLGGRLGEQEDALRDGLTQLRLAFVSLKGEA